MNISFENIKKQYLKFFSDNTITPAFKSTYNDQNICDKIADVPFDNTLKFLDVDYDSDSRSSWSPATHLERTSSLAIKWYKLKSGEEKDNLWKTIVGLVDNWIKNDYQSDNWWYNDIFVPNSIANIAIIMWDNLDDDKKAKMLEIIGRGSFGVRPRIMEKYTGANLLWFASSTVKHAVLTCDEDLLKTAVERSSKEAEIGKEGLQTDASFFQHGRRLYSGGYGISFLEEISSLMLPLSGTKYQFSQDCMKKVSTYLLEGLRWMTQGNGLDYACVGREYTRKEGVSAHKLLPAIERMLLVDEMPRKDEIKKFVDDIKNKNAPVSGIKLFDVAYFVAAHIDDIYIGFKGHNDFVEGAEIINEEGILSYNMSYGTHTCVMRTGEEYQDISPVWDYALIPGTTTRYEDDETLLSYDRIWTKRKIEDGCFGAKAYDDCAVLFERALHEGVSAKVTCFATPVGVVLMGSDICEENGAPLVTTVEQCNALGDEFALKNDGKLVLYNGVAYKNLDDSTKFDVRFKDAVGSWKRNNVAMSDDEVSKKLFLITMDMKNQNGHYAYVITSKEKADENFEVLKNDAFVQSIKLPDGRILAVFYKDCSFEYNGKTYKGNKNTSYCF